MGASGWFVQGVKVARTASGPPFFQKLFFESSLPPPTDMLQEQSETANQRGQKKIIALHCGQMLKALIQVFGEESTKEGDF